MADRVIKKCICRKIPKISPGAYIFQRPFLRGLYTEENYVSKLARLYLEGNLRLKIDWPRVKNELRKQQ